MIPERAFKEALGADDFQAVDPERLDRAEEVAGLSRDGAVIGVVAEAAYDVTFEADIFIVTREGRHTGDGRTVEAGSAYVAAVSLSGTSPWVAHGPDLLLDRTGAFPTTFCCSDLAPGGLHGWCDPSDQPAGGGGGGCGPDMYCPAPGGFLDELYALHSASDYEEAGHDVVGPLGRPGLNEQTFDCRVCERVRCPEPGTGTDPTAPWEGECARAYVPEYCHLGIWSPEQLPPECGGYCGACFDAYEQLCGTYPLPWSPLPARCTTTPEYCDHVMPDPDSNVCDPEASERVREGLEMLARATRTGGVVCMGGDGPGPDVEQCWWCNSEAECMSCQSPSLCGLVSSEAETKDKGVNCNEQPDHDACKCLFNCPAVAFEDLAVNIGLNGQAAGDDPAETEPEPDKPQDLPPPQDHDFPPKRVHDFPPGPGDNFPPRNGEEPPSDEDPPWIPTTVPSDPPFIPPFQQPPPMPPAGDPVQDPEPAQGGDPITLSTGSFTLDHVDLSFDGPVRPLEFRRSYQSRSTDRSVLGSNWTHTYDARIEVLKPRTAPTWASAYCTGLAPLATCLLYYDGTGAVRLFMYEKTAGAYLPQAGSTDTIIATLDGWALRTAQGHIRVFNGKGHLVSDRDRSGNGFDVEYEPTPLFALYQHYCPRIGEGSEEEPRSTGRGRWAERLGRNPIDIGRIGRRNQPVTFCEYLAYVFGDLPMPDMWEREWRPEEMTPPRFHLGCQTEGGPGRRPGIDCRIEEIGLDEEIAYLGHVVSLGVMPESLTGRRKLRPVRVTDDLGRSLEFSYYGFIDPQHDPGTLMGLLESVTGPAGTRLTFSYDRPQAYPVRLNEMFLTGVSRSDSSAGTDDVMPSRPRGFTFTYQWQGQAEETYADHEAEVYAAYYDYFSQFLGCEVEQDGDCNRAPSTRRMDGDPCFVSALQTQRYISSIADNIIRVRFDGQEDTGPSRTCVESETRYVADPFDIDRFDRAVEQAYGGARCEAGSAGAFFTTSYPKTRLFYGAAAEAQPWIPPEVLARYALDDPPPPEPEPVIPPSSGRWACFEREGQTECFPIGQGRSGDPGPTLCIEVGDRMECRQIWSGPTRSAGEPDDAPGDPDDGNGNGVSPQCNDDDLSTTGERRSCSLGMSAMNAARLLPGYREPFPYYALDEETFEGRLVRTRLSCDDLASAQLRDLLHNDLSGRYVPDDEDSHDPLYGLDRIVGGRDRVRRDLQRICTWSAVVDRDGIPTVLGLNYKGQALVTASRSDDGATWIFQETLYNADGMPIEIRRPTAGADPWTPDAGFTALAYDEVDPSGNDGWNGWLPAYWTRRMNLIERREVPAGGEVVDPTANGGRLAERITRYRYEPIYNQPRSVTWLSRAPGASEAKGLYRVHYTYDYQLASLPRLEGFLDELRIFGFEWLTKDDEGLEYDLDLIAAWQLPLKFHDVPDLPDDHVRFHARGLPVQVSRLRPEEPVSRKVHRFAWAAGGGPAIVVAPDGGVTRFEYYPISPNHGGPSFGGSGAPSEPGFGGLLASVTREAVRPLDENARDAVDRAAGCAALAGPYEWLLDASCGSAAAELTALGLPESVVAAIVEAASPASQAGLDEHVEYHYTSIGRPHTVVRDGLAEHFVHDTDGRVLAHVDPIGNTTAIRYSFLGEPIEEVTTAGNTLLRRVVRQHDPERRPLTECVELEADGCALVTPGGGLGPGQGLWPADGLPPAGGQMNRWRYTDEGRLVGHRDPEGLHTLVQYGARGLPRRFITTGRVNGFTAQRFVDLAYTVDGDLAERTYSGQNGLSLFETFTYDGLRRPVSRRDLRGSLWQQAFDPFDRVVAVKQDTTPYGAGAGSPSWEERVERDVHGRVIRLVVNDVAETVLERDAAGRVYRSQRTGEGAVEQSHDHLGRVVWQEDAAGTMTVRTFHPGRREMTEARIRRSESGAPLATSQVVHLDEHHLPVFAATFGHFGEVQQTEWERSAAGFVTEMTRPDDSTVAYPSRNLFGWPLQVDEVRFSSTGGITESTAYTYNARGQVTSVLDASGDTTVLSYDGFGAPERLSRPGLLAQIWEYDALGRLQLTRRPSGEILQTIYDGRGDPVEERWLNGPPVGSEVHIGGNQYRFVERAFDDLGRLTSATAFNPLANVLVPNGSREVTLWLDYDALGRVSAETVKVGPHAPQTVASTWSVGGAGTWQRDVAYPTGTQWRRSLDAAGRLSRLARMDAGGQGLATDFSWWGELYAGRVQTWSSTADPLVESSIFDGLGRRQSWRYDTVEVGASGLPWSPTWGARYCGGSWDPACADPLLEIEALYDVMGRIGSLSWRHGHPVFDETGGLDPGHVHPVPWRGFGYDGQGQLIQEWTHPGEVDVVDAGLLANHHLTEGEVSALAGQHGAQPWRYEREEGVAGLSRIVRESDGQARWSSAPRATGHRLTEVTVDGEPHDLGHVGGRMEQGPGWQARYGPNDELVRARRTATGETEHYLFDPLGRLTAVLDGGGVLQQQLVHDGAHMVASVDGAGTPLWEATWGPGMNRLLAWRDIEGGTGTHIPLLDHRRSPVAVWRTDEEAVTELAHYDVNGRLTMMDPRSEPTCEEVGTSTVCGGLSEMPFGWKGMWRSEVTGLVHMRARWYDPVVGEMTTPDPLLYIDSNNPYAYAAFDPVNNWDPWGQRGIPTSCDRHPAACHAAATQGARTAGSGGAGVGSGAATVGVVGMAGGLRQALTDSEWNRQRIDDDIRRALDCLQNPQICVEQRGEGALAGAHGILANYARAGLYSGPVPGYVVPDEGGGTPAEGPSIIPPDGPPGSTVDETRPRRPRRGRRPPHPAPGIYVPAEEAGPPPAGYPELLDLPGQIDDRGDYHHPISVPVHREGLADHETLSGIRPYDPRFGAFARNKQAHNYGRWHREMDREIIQWLERHPRADMEMFEEFLRNLFSRPDLQWRFPWGLTSPQQQTGSQADPLKSQFAR